MVAFLTIFLLAENLQQPIRVFEIGGYGSCQVEQNASYHVKEHENLYQKIVSKVTLHFFLKPFVEKTNSALLVVIASGITLGVRQRPKL